MPQVTINQIQINYQQIGRPSQKSALLLHGWRGSWQSFSPLVQPLSQQYQLIIPDLPGFGQSFAPTKGWPTSHFGEFLADFLTSLEISELDLVIGHSFGGKVAAYSWLGKQAKMPVVPKKGLFLIGPSGIPAPQTKLVQIIKSVSSLVPELLKNQISPNWKKYLYAQIDTDLDYAHATQFQKDTLKLILSEDLRQLMSQPSNIPLNLFWGETDQASPVQLAYEWLKLSYQSQVFVVSQADHFAHLINQNLFLKWLDTWTKI